jgi:hypothetical protein
MTQDTIQNRTAYSWFVCQKCMSPEEEEEELLIPPNQPIILCKDA